MDDSRDPQSERLKLIESMEARYARAGARARRNFRRKQILWVLVVSGARFLKRALDISGSLLGLVLLSPLMLIVAMLIRFSDPGPILYVSDRVGQHGRPFRFPKFRSMTVNASSRLNDIADQNQHGDSLTFKMRDDPRTTLIGRFIRKLSIDELPQLWCVLKGEMSLVGPRPPLPSEVARYSVADRRRLEVRPGLTCLWQIGGRGDVPFEKQKELDLEYIESSSFWTDIKILLKTIPAVLLGRGAY